MMKEGDPLPASSSRNVEGGEEVSQDRFLAGKQEGIMDERDRIVALLSNTYAQDGGRNSRAKVIAKDLILNLILQNTKSIGSTPNSNDESPPTGSHDSDLSWRELLAHSPQLEAVLWLAQDVHGPDKVYSVKDGVVDRHGYQRRIRARIDQNNILWLSVDGAGAWFGILQWPKEVYTLQEMLTALIEAMERSA